MIKHQIRVRYAETDQMGVAHHGAYVPWLEEARIETMRKIGVSYRDMEEQGIGMPVIELHVKYKKTVLFDDVVDLTTRIEITGPSRVIFHTDLSKNNELCAQAEVVVAAVNSEGTPIRLPDELIVQLHQGAS